MRKTHVEDEARNEGENASAGRLTALLSAWGLVTAGVVMLFTPGPGLLTIAAGLVLAGRTLGWTWTARLTDRAHNWVERRRSRADTPDHDRSRPGRSDSGR